MITRFVLKPGEDMSLRTLAAPASPLPYDIQFAETGEQDFDNTSGTFTNTVSVVLSGPVTAGKSRTIKGYTIHNPTTNAAATVIVQRSGGERFRVTLQSGDTMNERGIYDLNGALKTLGSAATTAVFTRTSTSSNTITNNVSRTFAYTNTPGIAWIVGMRLRAAQTTVPQTNWMEGIITAVSATSVTILVDATAGAGTINNWSIGITGSVTVTANTPSRSQTINANYNAVIGDNGSLLNVTTGGSTIDVTLPSASSVGNGFLLFLRKSDTGVGVARFMDGVTPLFTLSRQSDVAAVFSDGTNYVPLYGIDVPDVRSVPMVSNGVRTINTIANGVQTFHEITLDQFTGATTENNAIDISNPRTGDMWIFNVSRDATAATKTLHFPDAKFVRSYGASPQAIGINEKWDFIVRVVSPTELRVSTRKY